MARAVARARVAGGLLGPARASCRSSITSSARWRLTGCCSPRCRSASGGSIAGWAGSTGAACATTSPDAALELLERDDERAVLEAAIERVARRRAASWSSPARRGSARPRWSPRCARRSAPRRVLWGACDPLITPRPMGPLLDVARAGRRPDARRRSRTAARARASWPRRSTSWPAVVGARRRGPALGRRRDARPRGAARPAAGALARLPDPDLPQRRAGERPEVRRVLGGAAARVRAADRAGGAVGGGGRACSRGAAGPRRRRTCTRSPAATRSSSPRRSPRRPAPACRRACARRSRCASPRSAAAARAVIELAAVVPGATELWLLGDRGRGAAAIDACIDAGPAEPARRGARVPPRPRAAGGRGRASRRVRRRELDRLVLRALEAAGGRGPGAARAPRAPRRRRRTRSAGSRPPPRGPRAPRAGTGRRSSTGRRRSRPAAATTRRRSRASPSRRTCAGAPSARWRRAARCSAIHEAAGDALRGRRRPALALAHPVVGGPGRGGGRGRRPGDRGARGVPREPRAGDGAERPLAARDARPSATRRRSRSARARSALGAPARRPRDGRPRADERRHGAARRPGARARACAARGGVRARGRRSARTTTPARALVNLASATLVRRRDDPRVDADLERALRFARERELDGYVQYLLGVRANLRLLRGEWDGGRGRRARVARRSASSPASACARR